MLKYLFIIIYKGQTHHGQPMKTFDMGETFIPKDIFIEFLHEISHRYRYILYIIILNYKYILLKIIFIYIYFLLKFKIYNKLFSYYF